MYGSESNCRLAKPSTTMSSTVSPKTKTANMMMARIPLASSAAPTKKDKLDRLAVWHKSHRHIAHMINEYK